jgi:hypothetical protein
MKTTLKAYPYTCSLCKKNTVLLKRPFEGMIFRCFNCDEAMKIEEIIYLYKDRSGPMGLSLRHIPKDELESLLKNGDIIPIDFDKEIEVLR